MKVIQFYTNHRRDILIVEMEDKENQVDPRWFQLINSQMLEEQTIKTTQGKFIVDKIWELHSIDSTDMQIINSCSINLGIIPPHFNWIVQQINETLIKEGNSIINYE